MWRKKIEQKFRVYISTDHVRMTKFSGKSIFVVLWVKKTKNCFMQTLILSPNFVFFS
jgi:hypothetical protein